jgi:hypothetical protein
MQEHDAERYVCILDPIPALDALVRKGKIRGEHLEFLNADLDTMGLPPLPRSSQVLAQAAAEQAQVNAVEDALKAQSLERFVTADTATSAARASAARARLEASVEAAGPVLNELTGRPAT